MTGFRERGEHELVLTNKFRLYIYGRAQLFTETR